MWDRRSGVRGRTRTRRDHDHRRAHDHDDHVDDDHDGGNHHHHHGRADDHGRAHDGPADHRGAGRRGVGVDHGADDRSAAADAFTESVRTHGILLTTDQIRRQYDRYNLSATAPEETQAVLGRLLDAIERKTEK